MNQSFLALITFIIGIILFLIFIAFVYIWLFVARKQGLRSYVGERPETKRKRPLKERLWSPILKLSDKIGPTAYKYPMFANVEKDKQFLIWAGRPLNLTIEQYYGMRYVLAFGSLLFFWIYQMLGLPFGLPLLLIVPISGFFFPQIWLRLKAKERQEIISVSMPDFLDIVSISLKAGASLDGALRQVVDKMDGPLSEEIGNYNREISLGVPRKNALQRLLDHNYAKELESLVQALIQGDDLGVPISTTFTVQPTIYGKREVLRRKKKQRKLVHKLHSSQHF
ncbi:type II secretion system F family protein [Geomicrobium sp. JCM 19039]|uniref:type II secretion system F family protein n=1 Tax=Geomicrobium sp. JCM 19039 TaxID=1460636 RepID=UPI00045F2681|nr:type II secretion system F family protein [Geomicrobium sp. JCM 19039]GAK13686.1 type II/IV secretion system protein TadC, associated with Flp pilus assembly [Geomicrobium sp. JCM 19039]